MYNVFLHQRNIIMNSYCIEIYSVGVLYRAVRLYKLLIVIYIDCFMTIGVWVICSGLPRARATTRDASD